MFTAINTRYLDNTNIRVRAKEHVRIVYEREFVRSKMLQINKLDKLTRKKAKNSHYEPDLRGTLLKRWVKVLFQYKPTDSETKLLAKGLNFAIALKTLLVIQVVIETEIACQGNRVTRMTKRRQTNSDTR